MSEQTMAVSDDALKLLVAEHGVRGTARLLGMNESQTHAFRQRATRGKWLHDPAMIAVRERTMVAPANVAKPIVATVSPQAAIAAELASLGQQTRVSIARGIAKASEHIEAMPGSQIVEDANNIKAVAQTADLVHGWKDAAPQVKIRLDVLNAPQEAQAIEVETVVTDTWADDSVDPLDEY